MKEQIVGTMTAMIVPTFLFTYLAYVYFRKKKHSNWKKLFFQSFLLGIGFWLVIFFVIRFLDLYPGFFVSYGITPGIISFGFVLRILMDLWSARKIKERNR